MTAIYRRGIPIGEEVGGRVIWYSSAPKDVQRVWSKPSPLPMNFHGTMRL